MALFDHVDFSKVRRLYFAGGEPLIAQDHYRFLKRLIDEGLTDLELSYTTNFSRVAHKDYEIFELWSRFPRLILGISVDSWGERAEYIRSGQNWKQTEIDLRKVRERLPHAVLVPSCTVSSFNLLTLPDFIERLHGQGLLLRSEFHLHLVFNPREFRIDCMGPEFQKRGLVILDDYLKFLAQHEEKILHEKVSGIRSFLVQNLSEDLRSKLLNDSQAKDSIRNTSIKKTFPELHFLWED